MKLEHIWPQNPFKKADLLMKLEHIWPPNPLKSADFSDEIKTILTHKALKK